VTRPTDPRSSSRIAVGPVRGAGAAAFALDARDAGGPRRVHPRGRGLVAAVTLAAAALPMLAPVAPAAAQPMDPGRVDLPFNRYYDLEELEAAVREIAAAYPELVELREIGRSLKGHPILVAIVTSPGSDHREKPAMWIDGNVHGNEIQASEVVLYSLWYLVKEYGRNQHLTELLDRTAIYLCPTVNPDGRAYWFEEANTSSTSRSNQRPIDSDRDGLYDEDPPNDLDGDGSITRMWKRDPDGDWIRDRNDPRIFTRVGPGEKGDWIYLGTEGIDDDGDGRINEDPIGGDDMNRNWPGDWQPSYVQWGAGPYPLQSPETRAVAEFIAAHPNIAASQSYHNTGGMVLRGPGTDYMQSAYSRRDRAVYDGLAELGALMNPGYRSLVIFSDLYNVHGGFATWVSESLGVISFTNELWTTEKYFYRDGRPTQEQMWVWRDHLAFGELFTDYTEVEHPQHGTVLVGGPNKWSSRVTPLFMLEEECHRNFAFTMLHAGAMPEIRFHRAEVERLAGDLWQVTIAVRNDRVIPTRTDRAIRARIGAPDILEAGGDDVEVLASAVIGSRLTEGMPDGVIGQAEPDRLVVAAGVPSRGDRLLRLVVRGERGAELRLAFASQKAIDIETTVTLEETEHDVAAEHR